MQVRVRIDVLKAIPPTYMKRQVSIVPQVSKANESTICVFNVRVTSHVPTTQTNKYCK